jgi:hypothetical protein
MSEGREGEGRVELPAEVREIIDRWRTGGVIARDMECAVHLAMAAAYEHAHGPVGEVRRMAIGTLIALRENHRRAAESLK